MIKKIINPKTDLYKSFKSHVLGADFSWYWLPESTPGYYKKGYDNIPHFSHSFLTRSPYQDIFYTRANSVHIDFAHDVFLEICKANNIEPVVIYRMNANLVLPTESMKYSVPHTDHKYPHKNMLVYLTDPNGGDTACEGENFLASEDDVIIMEGEHCHRPPIKDRRIVLVYTFLDCELRDRCFSGLELLNKNNGGV